jgi:hypothetical protein
MSTRRRRRSWKQSIDGQFAPRRIEMLESPAYRALTLSGHRVLARVEIELAHHGGSDNGRLPVTYEDFHRYGMDRHAIAPAIRLCVALGFLEITEQGRGGNREFRTPSKYRVTYRHCDRAKPTDEWRRIQTAEGAEAIAQIARNNPIKSRSAKKQNSGGGKRHVSVGKNHTENGQVPVGKTPTTASVEKPPLLSISRGGRRGRSAVVSIQDLSNGFNPHSLPRALWVTAAPNPENPDYAIVLIALEGDVP